MPAIHSSKLKIKSLHKNQSYGISWLSTKKSKTLNLKVKSPIAIPTKMAKSTIGMDPMSRQKVRLLPTKRTIRGTKWPKVLKPLLSSSGITLQSKAIIRVTTSPIQQAVKVTPKKPPIIESRSINLIAKIQICSLLSRSKTSLKIASSTPKASPCWLPISV